MKMKQFNHPNVMNLIGVCITAGPAPYIVMPFMANGSLLSYLRKERSNILLNENTDEDLVRDIYCSASFFFYFHLHTQLLGQTKSQSRKDLEIWFLHQHSFFNVRDNRSYNKMVDHYTQGVQTEHVQRITIIQHKQSTEPNNNTMTIHKLMQYNTLHLLPP